MAHLVQELDTTLVATFDTEGPGRLPGPSRPILHVVEGVNHRDDPWPSIELRHGVRPPTATHVLLLAGAEPDARLAGLHV